MQTWWRAAVVAVVSMAGLGYAVGSVLGDDERLPDVGAPVVLGTSGDLPAHERADDELGGIVYPDPEGEPGGAALARQLERRELRQDRRELRQDRREARLERREERDDRRDERERRRPQPPPSSGDDTGAGDDGDSGEGGDDRGGDDRDSDDRDSDDRGRDDDD
jgi:hypothetical protein